MEDLFSSCRLWDLKSIIFLDRFTSLMYMHASTLPLKTCKHQNDRRCMCLAHHCNFNSQQYFHISQAVNKIHQMHVSSPFCYCQLHPVIIGFHQSTYKRNIAVLGELGKWEARIPSSFPSRFLLLYYGHIPKITFQKKLFHCIISVQQGL